MSEFLLNVLRWREGRQGTGYDKMLLMVASWPIPFDCYLLRYLPGTEIPPHRDPVSAGRHYRLNLVIKAAKSGGTFVCEAPIINYPRLKVFRSDQSTHSVTKIVEGSRYVLSVGWLLGKGG